MEYKNSVKNIIEKNSSEKQLFWIEEIVKNLHEFTVSFVAAPRFVGKEKLKEIDLTVNELQFRNWSIDQIVRLYIILMAEKNVEIEKFFKQMETLFETAEINEAVALYKSLPFLENPKIFLQRATDAVRSNIGDVFDAIAFENTFPSYHFNELAWNQLVLKCIFNDKTIHRIIGLEKRANKNLAETLSDFAHERWAAGRTVPAQVWQLVVNFVDDNILEDIQTLFKSQIENNLIAAVLVCQQSNNQKAKVLLNNYLDNVSTIFSEKINWKYLENKE